MRSASRPSGSDLGPAPPPGLQGTSVVIALSINIIALLEGSRVHRSTHMAHGDAFSVTRQASETLPNYCRETNSHYERMLKHGATRVLRDPSG